jgi:hypothetical protein
MDMPAYVIVQIAIEDPATPAKALRQACVQTEMLLIEGQTADAQLPL